MEADWLVAGLGNPGPAYVGTRHNLGFLVLDQLAAGQRFRPAACQAEATFIRVSGVPVALVKPQTFMNRSGDAVGGWLRQLGLTPERLIVVHDDLDLPVGRLRISAAAGPGGHRGVASIQAAVGTTQFPRVRVGIGRPEPDEPAEQYVLRAFRADEAGQIDVVLPQAAEASLAIIRDGVAAAMNQYNRREPSGPPDESSDVSTEKAR